MTAAWIVALSIVLGVNPVVLAAHCFEIGLLVATLIVASVRR